MNRALRSRVSAFQAAAPVAPVAAIEKEDEDEDEEEEEEEREEEEEELYRTSRCRNDSDFRGFLSLFPSSAAQSRLIGCWLLSRGRGGRRSGRGAERRDLRAGESAKRLRGERGLGKRIPDSGSSEVLELADYGIPLNRVRTGARCDRSACSCGERSS